MIIKKFKRVAFKIDYTHDKDLECFSIYTPNIHFWKNYSDNTICLSFVILLWDFQLWIGNIKDLI